MVSESPRSTASEGSRPAATGSGSHGPTYSSRRRERDRRLSRARRDTTVVNQAAGLSSRERSTLENRTHASCTTSSASANELVMR